MASTCAGAVAGALLLALARKKSATPPEEPICTGYHTTGIYEAIRDCTALRSPLCGDGRCSYHCGKLCKCDAAYQGRKCA